MTRSPESIPGGNETGLPSSESEPKFRFQPIVTYYYDDPEPSGQTDQVKTALTLWRVGEGIESPLVITQKQGNTEESPHEVWSTYKNALEYYQRMITYGGGIYDISALLMMLDDQQRAAVAKRIRPVYTQVKRAWKLSELHQQHTALLDKLSSAKF